MPKQTNLVEVKTLDFAKIAAGGAVTAYHRCLSEVMLNILDEGRRQRFKRELTQTFFFAPHEDRFAVNVRFSTVTKLAPRLPKSAMIQVGVGSYGPEATETQLPMDLEVEPLLYNKIDTSLFSLETLTGGAVLERFDDAMDAVIRNIVDINFPYHRVRKIVFKTIFDVKEHRTTVPIEYSIYPVLAKMNPVYSMVTLKPGLECPTVMELNV